MTRYDAIVIGAGQPGPGVAGAFADDDKQAAALIEMAGSAAYLNFGCRPTKALRARSTQASFRRGRAHHGAVGLDETTECGVDAGHRLW